MNKPNTKGVGLGTASFPGSFLWQGNGPGTRLEWRHFRPPRSCPRRKMTPEKNGCRCVLSLPSQVTPAVDDDTSDLTELTVGNSSQFNQLVQSGDVRAATQLANAVLQTANQLNSTTTQDKIAVRNKNLIKNDTRSKNHK